MCDSFSFSCTLFCKMSDVWFLFLLLYIILLDEWCVIPFPSPVHYSFRWVMCDSFSFSCTLFCKMSDVWFLFFLLYIILLDEWCVIPFPSCNSYSQTRVFITITIPSWINSWLWTVCRIHCSLGHTKGLVFESLPTLLIKSLMMLLIKQKMINSLWHSLFSNQHITKK